MFGPIPHITLIRQFSNFLIIFERYFILTLVMAYLAFSPLWPFNVIQMHKGNQPLSWSSQIIFWLQRYDFYLVHTAKFQRDVQCDILTTILNIPMFTNIKTTTIFHVHRCELTNCKRFLSERLPSGSTMINIRWCYNCQDIHVHNICITKLWALSYYFL